MMKFIPYIITAASIIGTVANSLQKRWCFCVWICTNSFWCIYNAVNGSYAQALLYAFNLAMAILGLIKWRKNKRKIGRTPTRLDEKFTRWYIRKGYVFSYDFSECGVTGDEYFKLPCGMPRTHWVCPFWVKPLLIFFSPSIYIRLTLGETVIQGLKEGIKNG